jgi:hypothetical protein
MLKKDVVGLEEYAYVTFDGRVYSKERKIKNMNGFSVKPESELTGVNNGLGYLQVRFTINGKTYRKYIHRMVAEAFIPNPHGYSEVNHIDGDKSNNHVSNLEWCSRSYNIKHALKKGLLLKDNRGFFKSPHSQ